jgi:hypothetical protein
MTSEQLADQTTGLAVNAWLDGDKEKAAPLFQAAEAQHEQSAPREDGSAPPTANEPPAFSKMPPAPTAEAQVVSLAVNQLSSSGAPGHALMQEWGGPDSQNFADNISYARQAVQEISKTNPGILEFLGRVQTADNGATFRAGDDPKWLKLAAEHGRLRAGFTNERPQMITSNYRPQPTSRPASGNNKQSLREEMDSIMQKNPPGSQAYASSAVQRRLNEISEALAGSGPIVGSGGRNA